MWAGRWVAAAMVWKDPAGVPYRGLQQASRETLTVWPPFLCLKHILRGSKQILHDQFPQQSDFSTFLSGVSMIFPCALTQETSVFFF